VGHAPPAHPAACQGPSRQVRSPLRSHFHEWIHLLYTAKFITRVAVAHVLAVVCSPTNSAARSRRLGGHATCLLEHCVSCRRYVIARRRRSHDSGQLPGLGRVLSVSGVSLATDLGVAICVTRPDPSIDQSAGKPWPTFGRQRTAPPAAHQRHTGQSPPARISSMHLRAPLAVCSDNASALPSALCPKSNSGLPGWWAWLLH
jgi:hypothetical protein